MPLLISEIKDIAKKLTTATDRKQYNSIIKLVNELVIPEDVSQLKDEETERNLRFLIMSLFQIFKKLFSRSDLTLPSSKKATLEKEQFVKWCRKVYEAFKAKLLSIISDIPFETSLGLDSLDVYLQLMDLESTHFASKKDAPFFPNKTFRKLIIALWSSNMGELESARSSGASENVIIIEFTEKYYKKFADIQYYFQSEFNQLLEDPAYQELLLKNVGKWLTLANHDEHCSSANVDLEVFVPNPPQAIENDSKYKSNFEKNWLSLLNGQLSLQQYKTILLILHKRIIPHFHTPTKLMDFLTDSYNLQNSNNNAGVIPILALNGLFELMRRFNLEYPNFYKKLYQIINSDLMHVKYRARFFRLMDIFLSSTHLSAHLVASFMKRLARLTLESPPSAIVSVIPFIYNLIRKHPNCMIMLHNPAFISDPFQTPEQVAHLKNLKDSYVDPFNVTESDPELTHALDSSLWELASLMEHYHPNVATLAKVFSQPFKKLSYNMEDFLDWSYDSLLSAESSRRLKTLPTLEFETFGSVFDNEEGDEESSSQDNVYLPGVAW
ncbi:ribosome biosynthesis protein NOC4 [Saccharomyces eubayanus]|uniref:ribosome biosynthesis protein NOC4 n=1 Tax=Saccharomyces eubayanus TaxID=1080349 RepID=UPI0006C3B81F|nr:NOC4-like protein [Saccharomyces eubayanus]KOG96428.1 NOC4-like protein [Saccharomyces eubayanus]